jgi:hypothetical protein
MQSDLWSLISDHSIFIDPSRLQKLYIIGQGQFGCVFKGILASEDCKEKTDVSIKTVKIHTAKRVS